MMRYKNNKIKSFILLSVFLISLSISIMLLSFGDSKAYAERDNDLVVKVIASDSNEKMINGDCIFIVYKDIEILVDCASYRGATSEKIKSIMNAIMEEDGGKVWDYIIFTHPDEDHIGNYVSTLERFNKEWSLKNIIDFDIIPDEIDNEKVYTPTTNKYRTRRQDLIKEGTNYFAASSLSEDNKTKTFVLCEGNESVLPCYLTILYNFYDNYKTVGFDSNGKISDSDTNLVSVCFLIQIGEQKLLFTGDLTKVGEERLLENHKELLKNVTFFKAGHHGSQGGKDPHKINNSQSNSEMFVDWIKPQYVSITSKQGAGVTDVSINTFHKYTDYIFPGYVEWNENYYELYGDQEYTFDGYKTKVKTKNNYNDTTGIIDFKDAKITFKDESYCWYLECLNNSLKNIQESLYVYTFDDVIDGVVEGKAEHFNCTLIKFGSYDVLIDCGNSLETSDAFVKKLKDYVIDNKIECLIVTHNKPYCISQIAGNYTINEEGKRDVDKEGILDAFEVGMVIDSAHTNFDENNKSSCLYRYRSIVKDKISAEFHFSLKYGDEPVNISMSKDGPTISVYPSTFPQNDDENNYSLITIIDFWGEKLLFVGDLANYTNIIKQFGDDLKNVNYFRVSNSDVAIKDMPAFKEFAQIINPKYIVLGTPMFYQIQGLAKKIFDDDDLSELKKCFSDEYIYYLGYDFVAPGIHNYERDNGDLVYKLSYQSYYVNPPQIFKIETSKNEWITPYNLKDYLSG